MSQVQSGELAERAERGLLEVLSGVQLEAVSRPLVQCLANAPGTLDLVESSGTSKVILEFCGVYADQDLVTEYEFLECHLNMASLLAILLEHCSEKARSEECASVIDVLKECVDSVIDSIVTKAAGQLAATVQCVEEVSNSVIELRVDGGRVFIMEFPIGNSLTSCLLARRLCSLGVEPEIVRISLGRNDSADQGITRLEQLSQALEGMELANKDFVVYLDEWVTGSNFYSISKLLAKVTDGTAKFIPAAVLAESSMDQKRYESFERAHDRILVAAGVCDTAPFRAIVPMIPGNPGERPYFFWEDRDRIAGYRKMQLLGSIMSGFRYYVDLLANNPDLIVQTMEASIPIHEPNREEKLSWCVQGFMEAYKRFEDCMEVIGAIEHPSNEGLIDDPIEALKELTQRVGKEVENHPGGACIQVATYYQASTQNFSPPDRYFLRGTPAVASRLSGAGIYVSERLVESVIERF